MKFSILLISIFLVLSGIPSLYAEDIADLKRVPPVPGRIRGCTVNIENGRIDLHPPYVAHFPENKDGSFKFVVDVDFRDSTPRYIVKGRVEVKLYGETGEYGSLNWQPLWTNVKWLGTSRKARFLDQYKGSIESEVLGQNQPIMRYRVKIKVSTYGNQSRCKRLDYIFSVVSPIKQGRTELEIGLLLSREASVIYRHFASVFNELTRKRSNRRLIRFALRELNQGIRRFNYLVKYLAANPLLEDRFTFGHSMRQRASELAGITPISTQDITMPHYFVLDNQILQAMRKIAKDETIDFDKAFEATSRATTAIEEYAYNEKWSLQNLNHELYTAERMLVINDDSYSKSLIKASEDFEKVLGKLVWAPGDTIPEQKYLRTVEKRSKRFFDVPRYIAYMEVTAMRAIRAVNGK